MRNDETAGEIFRLMAEEGWSLRKCADHMGLPLTTCLSFVSEPKYAEQYARAREERANWYAERVLETVEDPKLDPADKRVRADAMKWFCARMGPKRWGDKVEHAVTGAEGGPLRTITEVRLVAPGTDHDDGDR